MDASNLATGGRLLVDALVANGVRHAFCVPGESYLAVLDALKDSPIALTVCRQEGGAAMMAEAVGKLTGTPGICMVTRGPGATNAAAGVHVAMQDSTPMILLVGQVERGFLDREAFQEVDYVRFFSPLAKWAAEIRDPARVPEYMSRAFAVATSGRPGPVVLSLPEDMLTERTPAVPILPATPAVPQIGLADLASLRRELVASKAPIAILGGSGWTAEAVQRMQRFAEKWRLPTAVSLRRQMLFDHEHPCFAGVVGIGVCPKLRQRVEAADLVLLVGGRLSEMPSQGYQLLDVPVPSQRLVHVHPGPDEIGRVYRPALGVVSGPAAFAAAVDGLEPPIGAPAWTGTAEAAHAEYLAFSEIDAPTPGRVQMREVMRQMSAALPEDAIITNGAGNFATWVHRFHRFRRFGTQLAPTSGSMGYGFPAAIAAKRLWPERPVVCVAGDGDFQMTCQELGTAVQFGANVVTVIVDNGIYGTIRMHQEREYPGRVSGSTLQNPDFAALARSYGAFGATVRETPEFAPAFAEAMAAGRPAVLHLLTDPDAITPTTTLAKIRDAALARA
jgi:acetolactate synthase-1/2/3 large subunit